MHHCKMGPLFLCMVADLSNSVSVAQRARELPHVKKNVSLWFHYDEPASPPAPTLPKDTVIYFYDILIHLKGEPYYPRYMHSIS